MHPMNEEPSLPPDAAAFLAEVRAALQQTPAEVVTEIRQQVEAAPGRWHLCPQRPCRRRRICASRYLDCARVVLSPEQRAQTLARLNRALAQGR